MSSLSWLDHSEAERRRALDVIDLFRDRGTVDELGIGVIRDTFADALFPGTSTVQTRARYFLFVPWIYTIVARGRSAEPSAARARRLEIGLIKPLMESEDHEGVIGSTAGRSLKRLPSNTYWRGLLTWGIRAYRGNQPQFHRLLDSAARTARRVTTDDDGQPLDAGPSGHWHAGLPPEPSDFPTSATLRLRRLESEYLRDRILATNAGSMLATLVDEGQDADTPFPWELPELGVLSAPTRELLDHAQAFSEVMHGAQLLYNLMLAERADNEEWEDRHQHEIRAWVAVMERRERDLLEWDRGRFWDLVARLGGRPSFPTRAFIDAWLQRALRPGAAESVAGDTEVREAIEKRERMLKGARARLFNERALALWGGDSGSRQLTYRWPVARQMVNDIVRGFEEDA